jgi:phosphoserine phosphatase
MDNRVESRRGLVVFDLDGTLLRGKTVCEILAAPLGRSHEMQQFEALTLEADIAQARALMATWYSGHTMVALQAHLANAHLAHDAAPSIVRLQEQGFEVAIASITWKFAVGWFAKELGVRHYLGTDLLPSHEISHIWGRDKATWMTTLASQYKIPYPRLAAVGDSNGDIEMLRVASLRFFVGAVPPSNVSDIIHCPNSDIGTIADHILDAWAA